VGKQQASAEQILGKLREAEVLQGKGISMEEILRQPGISDATYYRWPKEYGGLRFDQATQLIGVLSASPRGTLLPRLANGRTNQLTLHPYRNWGLVR
jgi:hypothetical protein